MALYADYYGILDTDYIVHAHKVDPCPHEHEDREWVIVLLLHVGKKAVHCALVYPTADHRDMAYEAISALVRRSKTLDVLGEDEE